MPEPNGRRTRRFSAALGRGAAAGGLGGLLGGLLGGGGGNVLNGGLRHLLQDMEQNGHADAVQSWVGRGENRAIAPTISRRRSASMTSTPSHSRPACRVINLLSELSEHLPEFVDQLTPDGRLPTEQEASRWV